MPPHNQLSTPPSARQLATIFHRYERDRVAFASACLDAARCEGNAAPLVALGAPALLLPLLQDSNNTVAHTAAFALGRLAGLNSAVATTVAAAGAVQTLVGRLKTASQSDGATEDTDASASKRATAAMLAALTGHSAELAEAVASQGGLDVAISCLQDEDREVREGAVWTLAHLAAQGEGLAARVCSAGALEPLVACLGSKTPGDAVAKRVAASALGDIAKHGAALAAAVVQAGAVHCIAALLCQPLCNDARLRRQLLCVLMHVAKSDAGLAGQVVEAGLVPIIGRCLQFADDTVRRHAAACLRDIARHTTDLAAAVAGEQGVLEGLASYAASASAEQALPALLAFGFIAGHSAELASKVATAPGAVPAIVAALSPNHGDESSRAAAAWALGRIGGYTPGLAQQAMPGLASLCSLAAEAPAGSDLQAKCIKATSAILTHLEDVSLLASLVMHRSIPAQLLELVLARCTAVMTKQPAGRAAFATSGALAHLEACIGQLPPNSRARELTHACLRLFPEELINFYSPTYTTKLLAQLNVDPPPADAITALPTSRQQEAQDALLPAAAKVSESLAEGMTADGQMEGGATDMPASAAVDEPGVSVQHTTVEAAGAAEDADLVLPQDAAQELKPAEGAQAVPEEEPAPVAAPKDEPAPEEQPPLADVQAGQPEVGEGSTAADDVPKEPSAVQEVDLQPSVNEPGPSSSEAAAGPQEEAQAAPETCEVAEVEHAAEAPAGSEVAGSEVAGSEVAGSEALPGAEPDGTMA